MIHKVFDGHLSRDRNKGLYCLIAHNSLLGSADGFQRLQENVRVLWSTNKLNKFAQFFRQGKQNIVFVIRGV